MTQFLPASRRPAVVRILVAMVVALLGASLLSIVSPAPANAAARLSASSSLGGATASASGATTFTVSGSGYQAIDGGFGGIYVAFGWVNGSNWGPSNGGSTGRTYDYMPDDQSKNNKGYQAFVAFPGSSTGGEAQATMSSSGSFQLSLTVPGPKFTGAGGKRIDCLTMTCGFFTFGAHGVRNGTNETFTPVTFQAAATPAAADEPAAAAASPAESGNAAARPSGTAAGRQPTGGRAAAARPHAAAPATSGEPAAGQDAGAAGGDAVAESGESGDASAPAATSSVGGTTSTTAALIEVDRKTAKAGGAMAFAAAGFWPGEQVYVVFDDGTAALGPVGAGIDGEIAGIIPLPSDLEAGTYEIRAAGAASALEAMEKFPIRVDIANTSASTGLKGSLSWIFLSIAALGLLAAVAFMVSRRRGGSVDDADDPDDPDDSDLPTDDSYFDSYGQPFPHPAMSGGPVDAAQPTSTFQERDPR